MNANLNFYDEKLILAPMVRISGLPMRLVALDYGADIVFCEEIIDFKMLQCKRVENELLDTTDFIWNDGTVVFRTCSRERDQIIFQIGTSDASRAVKVAKTIEDCVAGIDVNMGCPKEFSIKGGMGAALMGKPEKFTEILTSLVKAVKVPISCKTRIKPSVPETLEMIKQMEKTGISWITLHGRLREERPRHGNRDDVIAEVSKAIKISLIANGGSNNIKSHEDIDKFRKATNCPTVMLARAAMWNPSIFSKSGLKPLDDVIKKFLKYSIRYDNHLANAKYCMQQLLHDSLETERGKKLLDATSVREICALWNLEEIYDEIIVELEEKKKTMQQEMLVPYTIDIDQDGNKIYQIPYKYNKKDFEKTASSKMVLYEWSIRNKIEPPTYETLPHLIDRTYRAVMTFQGIKFASSLWDKSKKFSEQATACVCILLLDHQPFYCSIFPRNDLTPPTIPYSERSINYSNNKKKKNDPDDIRDVPLPHKCQSKMTNLDDHNSANIDDAVTAEPNLSIVQDSFPLVKRLKLDDVRMEF